MNLTQKAACFETVHVVEDSVKYDCAATQAESAEASGKRTHQGQSVF